MESLAEVVHPFAKRLEVHLPYLVELEGVGKLVERLVRDPKSDFGEFVRMQTEAMEGGGLSLASHLLKAPQRLMKYTLFFKVSDVISSHLALFFSSLNGEERGEVEGKEHETKN